MSRDPEPTPEPASHIEIIQPAHFGKPRGYSNGVAARGRALYVAGQIGWEHDGIFASSDFAHQFARALDHVLDVVRAAGGRPEHVVNLTVFVSDVQEYRAAAKQIGAAWRERFGRHYPAMALLGIAAFVEPGAKVEIQAIAHLPE